MSVPPFDRPTALARLGDEHFDVLVVGGGITGAGVALDAATRGSAHRARRTARLRFGHVVEVVQARARRAALPAAGRVRARLRGLAERQRLRKTAPHLVRVLPFLIPIFTRDGLINPKLARALGSAMWMYDLTGGVRIGKLHKRLSKDEALAHMPTLPVRTARVGVPLLRRAGRRRAPHAHHRAHGSRTRCGGRQLRVADRAWRRTRAVR